VRVRIPTPLRSYTGGASVVEAEGDTVAALLDDLERQFRGIRFRIVDEQGRLRTHVKVFVGRDSARDLTTPIEDVNEVAIMQALSGGCASTGS
jgi:molybdopterin converting factor small subunit